MIDFIKIYWKDKDVLEDFVLNENNFEEVFQCLEKHSGEIRYPYVVKFDGMKIVISAKSMCVKNSIHKSHNYLHEGLEHNYNDFTHSDLCKHIDYVKSRLTDVENSHLTQLEFGLNIPVNIPAESIIDNNVLMHKYKGASRIEDFNGGGKLKQFQHSNYAIKIYDKAKQFRRANNILRVELKFLKARDFQAIGIYKIDDLKDKKKLKKLYTLLLKRFDELIIIDNYDPSKIDEESLNLLRKYSNPNFWGVELNNKSRQTKTRHKKRYDQLLNQHNLQKTKSYLRSLIVDKFTHLINH